MTSAIVVHRAMTEEFKPEVFFFTFSEKPDDAWNSLERIFEGTNHGSPEENEEFKKSGRRSTSVGDLVFLDGKWWKCANVDWREVSADHAAEMFDTPLAGRREHRR